MKSSILGFFVALLFCFISMGIYFLYLEKKEYFLLDNPTDKHINLIINNNKITLNPKEQIKLNVLIGKNSLKILDSNKIIKDTFFIINKKDKRGLINPLFQDYYIFTQYYGVLKNKDSLMLSEHKVIDNQIFYGKINKNNNLLITDFYFNLDQEYQKVIKNIDTLERREKIFRKLDFIHFYNNKYR